MPQAHEWDRLVNSKWPADLAKPTAKEAITGAKRLYRKAMGRPFRGKVVVTSGRRNTWVRGGVLYVNPNRRWGGLSGWPEIIHLLAHWCHSRKNPRARPHDYRELELEAELTRYAIEQGFHLGKLKRPEKPKAPEPTREATALAKAAAAREAMERWEAKRKRAETALRKYHKKARYYEKAALST